MDPVTGASLGGHKLDQYGIYLGGPASIPKIYNAKDKTFLSFTFENYRESTPSPGKTSVPTAAMRTGDFSGTGISIYDPLSTRLNPNFNAANPAGAANPQYIRDRFPNNIIPANRIDPVGQAILNAYPAPNTGGSALFNNYFVSPNLSTNSATGWGELTRISDKRSGCSRDVPIISGSNSIRARRHFPASDSTRRIRWSARITTRCWTRLPCSVPPCCWTCAPV